ncbi:phosphatase PAP2 family protein [Blastococcus goldschmidtiae]|uniref:Phosphatase PAP2 family protein n=1 Tax=Blastococcus goldschmidtiae TaxID=3075546 RepID=A0ABU2K7N4_9ACTN|nr:phosphatase PAP2 family protein [Blastococcus sp. DSM 46792]MDT0276178.1 phosphatase PAP2 family protein [Blastococcus sp. DSM 46792]
MSVPPDGGTTVTRSRAPSRAPGVLAVCAAVLALLGVGVRTGVGPQQVVDAQVSEAVYVGDDRSRGLDLLLEVLTAPGLSWFRIVVAVPVLIWLVRRRAWRTVLWVLAAAVLVAPVTAALKEFFGRVRPAFDDGGARYDSLSFPSGHSSGIATLVAVGLLLAWPSLAPGARQVWTALGVLLVVLVGLTRMWLGVHYLSDVLAGWSPGLGWTLLAAVLMGVLPLRPRELP